MTIVTDLVRVCNDNVEIYVDENTGATFTSVKAYARMSGKDQSTISRRLKGLHKGYLARAQIQTEGGLQGVALVDEDTMVEWLIGDNPEMLAQFAKLGIRKFLHAMAGYQSKVEPYVPLLPDQLRYQLELIGWIEPGDYLPLGCVGRASYA